MEKPRLKSFLLVSETRDGGEHTVVKFVSLESYGEILGANYEKVILDRKHFSSLVQVIDIGSS